MGHFTNNLNGFWNFYHGTNMGLSSPKAIGDALKLNFPFPT
jgi:hypothetical protein